MTRTDPHPIEVALVVALLALEAAAIVIASLVALLLTVAHWRPAAPPTGGNTAARSGEPQSPDRGMTPPQPLLHPLQALAVGLEALSCRELMTLAGTRRKLPKTQLIALVAACS
jgi:hypothetical protein